MKKTLISLALAVVAPVAWAQVSETTTTTTTTEGNGTITEYTPGSTIVLRETSGPRTYHFGKTVTYVTRSGKVLDEDTVRTRVRVGIPVRVHYAGTGDNVMVDRVILRRKRSLWYYDKANAPYRNSDKFCRGEMIRPRTKREVSVRILLWLAFLIPVLFFILVWRSCTQS